MTDDLIQPKLDSTLSKGLRVLEHLVQSPEGKGVSALARELGLSKSNTFRLLQTLVALGYVKHGAGKAYTATLKTWQIGRASIENLDLRSLAAPELLYLSAQTGEAICLAVPENLHVVYVDKLDGTKPVRSWVALGGTAPLHCVGVGKAILAANYDRLRPKIAEVLPRFTNLTITSMSALDADVRWTQEHGYAFDAGEFCERTLSFGAAITLPEGEAVAALGISVPDMTLGAADEARFGGLVRDAAARVSAKIAGR